MVIGSFESTMDKVTPGTASHSVAVWSEAVISLLVLRIVLTTASPGRLEVSLVVINWLAPAGRRGIIQPIALPLMRPRPESMIE